MSTRDEIVDMFIKHMSKLTTKAKEELERLRAEDRTSTEHLIEVFTDVLYEIRSSSIERWPPVKAGVSTHDLGMILKPATALGLNLF